MIPAIVGCTRPDPWTQGRETNRGLIPPCTCDWKDLDGDGKTDTATININGTFWGDSNSHATATCNGQSVSAEQNAQSTYSITIPVPEEGAIEGQLKFWNDAGDGYCKNLDDL
jgi:hypothetical protein